MCCQGITFWLHSKPYMHYFLLLMVVGKTVVYCSIFEGPKQWWPDGTSLRLLGGCSRTSEFIFWSVWTAQPAVFGCASSYVTKQHTTPHCIRTLEFCLHFLLFHRTYTTLNLPSFWWPLFRVCYVNSGHCADGRGWSLPWGYKLSRHPIPSLVLGTCPPREVTNCNVMIMICKMWRE
jgi:hypothetical protein